jgi:hypothetical protein
MADYLSDCNVVWTTPSADALGSMPLGNGAVGLNLWVQPNGDLQFYISRIDSLSEVARILKVGEVQISIAPNPFAAGQPFRQELVLRDGVCNIDAGSGEHAVHLQVFVDSDYPVIHVIGRSQSPVAVTARIVSWRTAEKTLHGREAGSVWTMGGAPFPLVESADHFQSVGQNAVAWYHRNETSTAFDSTMSVQSLSSLRTEAHDPILHRTFGGYVTGTGFKAASATELDSLGLVSSFSIRVAAPSGQPQSADEWVGDARKAAGSSSDSTAALTRTRKWWAQFWNRSWISVRNAADFAIPESDNPIRIGYDSGGGNKFPGEIGRFGVYGHALTLDQIKQLASTAPSDPTPVPAGVEFGGTGAGHEKPASDVDMTRGLTVEAWIRPAQATPGRIFDKVTAGADNGFLLDTHPGNTIRLIVGNTTLSAPAGTLTIGAWHHVAAVADGATGEIAVYLDGKQILGQPGSTSSSVTRGYTLQRFMQACQGRGEFPIKFNGGLFTVEPVAGGETSPDYRAWGDAYWFQNTRHMYPPMLASGDYEMMDPYFRLYENCRPLAEARAKLYHGINGGSYFPETMSAWGTYSNGDYGWNRTGRTPNDVQSPWWRFAWNQGLELVNTMLEYYDYTGDRQFLSDRALPMAVSVLNYFDQRFKRDAGGRIVLDPTQAIETYRTCTNDMPSVAGLVAVSNRLVALPDNVTTHDERLLFQRIRAACPQIPTQTVDEAGKQVLELAPAATYKPERSNGENPEMYAVWPFRLYELGKPDIDVALTAYDHRMSKLPVGWGYDGECAALLGLSDEAGKIMLQKCSNSNRAYRWPAYWGPNFDYQPDQNHGGNLLETLQLMLLQADNGKLRILPAWPKGWDVSFKLHAPEHTTVECDYEGGKITKLDITPAARRADVVLTAGTN